MSVKQFFKKLFILQKATGDRSRGFGKSSINVRIASIETKKGRTGDASGDVTRFQETINGTAGGFNENAKGIFTQIFYKTVSFKVKN